jgi:serine/threonine-protein kinase
MVDSEELPNESDPLVGRVLCAKWRIERLIGRGGMGAVYEATHRNGLRVAVKVLKTERTASSRMRARFVREGYVANMVAHPGVVTVLDDDVDEETGTLFFVMDLLEGETLARRAERGALPLDEVLRIVEHVLDVVSAAHEKGIIHRDVKPENVFLTEAGGVKLLDFGLARLRERVEAIGSHTESGAALGTLGFMAPEQARGRWDLVDGRTDVWAVGAMMFRLLTGRPVHRAKTPNELLIAAATEPAPSVTVRAWDLPQSVVDLVDRALAFEKEQRWPTSQAMLAALRQAQAETTPELLARTYANSEPPAHAETATERTHPPVTGEPAAISSNVLKSDELGRAAPKGGKLSSVNRWLIGAAGIAGIGVALALSWQAQRNDKVVEKSSSIESPAAAPPAVTSPPVPSAIQAPPPSRTSIEPREPTKQPEAPIKKRRSAVPPRERPAKDKGTAGQAQPSPKPDQDLLDVFD